MRKTINYTLHVLLILLVLTVFTVPHLGTAYAEDSFTYTVSKDDSLWDIANKFGTTVETLMAANNLSSDFLQVGQSLIIPVKTLPDDNQTNTADLNNNYTVVQGDCLWTIANKFGTTVESIKAANGLESDDLQVGQALNIPKSTAFNQPVSRGASLRTSTRKSTVGELVSWPIVDALFPKGSTAILQDFRTGRQFKIYRLFGDNHADCEPLTAEDSAIMKEVFGGQWSWDRRPAILIFNGRAIAASMAGMPHGNSQDIYGNDFDGMFDLHFLNSRTHGTDRVDPEHQAAVREAAGL